MPLSLVTLAGIAAVLAWKSPLWHRTMPKNIHPLESLGWLGLALSGLVLALLLGQGGREWHRAWPLWQQRALSLSLVIILTQGLTAGFFAAGSWAAAAFPTEGPASSEDYFLWSFFLLLSLLGVAAWLGLVLEDATGIARQRVPLFVLGLGTAWSAWRAPPWFRYFPSVLTRLIGLSAARVVTFVLGAICVIYALFGNVQSFH